MLSASVLVQLVFEFVCGSHLRNIVLSDTYHPIGAVCHKVAPHLRLRARTLCPT